MKRRALFVGVNEYEDPQITKLRYAIADASMMCGFFESLDYEMSSVRVCRGGSWDNCELSCRSASRGRKMTDGRYSDLGFRLACFAMPCS